MADAPPSSSLSRHWPGYVAGQDHNLRVNSWNSAAGVTITIAGAIASPDGAVRPFVYAHVPNTDRSQKTQIVGLEEGVILWMQAVVTAGTPIGAQCYVRVELIQGREGGTTSLATIVAGYITANSARAYPNDSLARSIDGPGFVRSVQNGAPGAGAEFTVTVPTNARWRPIALLASLTTAVAVANRFARIVFDDGVNVYAQMGGNVAQAASLVFAYTISPSNGLGAMSATDVLLPAPDWLVLPAAHRIRSSTVAIQGADQWSTQALLVEEWLDV